MNDIDCSKNHLSSVLIKEPHTNPKYFFIFVVFSATDHIFVLYLWLDFEYMTMSCDISHNIILLDIW